MLLIIYFLISNQTLHLLQNENNYEIILKLLIEITEKLLRKQDMRYFCGF